MDINELIARIVSKRPTGPLTLTEEYIARFAKDPEVLGDVRRWQIYEADWGFITEAPAPFLIWDFYAADVWRRGTDKYYDRFLTAWKNDVWPELRPLIEGPGRGFPISMDDGISNHSCISLGCLGTPEEQVLGRKWIAEEFVGKHWPVMLRRVLNPKHRFAVAWRNV